MRDGKPGGSILVGDNAAIVDTRKPRHHVALDGEDVALCATQSVTAGRGNSRGGRADVPLNRSNGRRGDLVRSCAYDV